jgi:hypothetical protein
MRRFFIILGIVLMVFAFVILGLFIIAPAVFTMDDAPLLKSIMQTLVCQPNEVLSASYSTYSTPGTTTRSTDLSCVDNEKHARDVSGQLIGVGAVGYLVPFLVGLFMTLLAANQSKTKSSSTTSDFNDTAGYFTDQHISAADDRRARQEAARRDREKQAARKAMREGGTGVNPSAPLPNHIPLAQRLRELKEAYDAGLVTEAEYSAKREALLNE